jgi:hypothetical protein
MDEFLWVAKILVTSMQGKEKIGFSFFWRCEYGQQMDMPLTLSQSVASCTFQVYHLLTTK